MNYGCQHTIYSQKEFWLYAKFIARIKFIVS